MLRFLLVSLISATLAHAQYSLQSNFSGPTFFDNFNFYNSWDPTYGYVHYVDRATAQSYGMINSTGPASVFGVEHEQVLDPSANLGRLSLRLSTIQSWTHGLFIADIAHMPATACGTWPAFWSLGAGVSPWPAEGIEVKTQHYHMFVLTGPSGEIDIIEYLNLKPNNSMALHTAPGCTIAGSGQLGTLLTNDCGKDQGVAGCYVAPNRPNNAGTAFNANGGGVYAMEWTSVAIRIWFFPRNSIPPGLASPNPDPATFGLPDANFEGGCDIDKYFFNHSLVFNTEFCGSWSGPTFIDDGCPALDPANQWASCNEFVAANPAAFVDSYWAVNYLHVFTTTPGSPPPPSSVLSSVTPAASSTSVTVSGAEGTSSTATGTLDPPPPGPSPTTSTPTSSSTPPALPPSGSSTSATSSSLVASSSPSDLSTFSTSSVTTTTSGTSTSGPVVVFVTTLVTVSRAAARKSAGPAEDHVMLV